MQLLFLGVIGEYLGRIYEEIKRRPHYIVRRVVSTEPALHRREAGDPLQTAPLASDAWPRN